MTNKGAEEMIGLEYICGLYNKKHSALAEELGISRQVVNIWIKGKRPIGKKHIPKLVETFNIPEGYFQKEVDEIDKLKIQQIKHENEYIGFEDTYIDSETVEEVVFWCEDSNHESYRELLAYEIKVKELHKNLQQTINNELKSDDDEAHAEELQYESEKLIDVYTELVNIIQESPKSGKDMLRRIITGIRVYQGKDKSEDQLSKDIYRALRMDNERSEQKSIEYEEDWR